MSGRVGSPSHTCSSVKTYRTAMMRRRSEQFGSFGGLSNIFAALLVSIHLGVGESTAV